MDDASYALRLGLRASSRGVLAPKTHTLLSLSIKRNGSSATTNGAVAPDERETTLMLADVASGDLHTAAASLSRYRTMSPGGGGSQSSAARSMAVLGACVAARAEGAVRGVPWKESGLSFLLREPLSGACCTAVLGCCGASEADSNATISSLHLLYHASRLVNRVRVPQPPLDALLRRLRSLEERLGLQAQHWIERRPPTAQPPLRRRQRGGGGGRMGGHGGARYGGGGGGEGEGEGGSATSTSRLATGEVDDEAYYYSYDSAAAVARLSMDGDDGGEGDGYDAAAEVAEAAEAAEGPFYGLASQLRVTLKWREEQGALLRSHVKDLHAAIADAGRQRRVLPWETERGQPAGGLAGARSVAQKVEQAEQLTKALEEWLREAHEATGALVRAVEAAGGAGGAGGEAWAGGVATPGADAPPPREGKATTPWTAATAGSGADPWERTPSSPWERAPQRAAW